MSAVVVLAPVVVASWPVLASAVVAAAAATGFRVVREPKAAAAAKRESVELTLENADVVAESMSPDEKIVVERQDVRVTFSRDARGRFRTCVEGGLSKDRLRAVGEEISGLVIQQYVYRRLSQELGRTGFSTLSEEKSADGSIHLRVRRFTE